MKMRKTIWFVMLASWATYFLIALGANTTMPVGDSVGTPLSGSPMTIPLYAVGLATALLSWMFPRLVTSKNMTKSTREIVQWVLAEGTTIYGLMLEFYDHGTPRTYSGVPLMGLGLILLLVLRPKPESRFGFHPPVV
jgi:hypothetical protein